MSSVQGWIAGRVVDVDGLPVAGAQVSLAGSAFASREAATTGPDGHFRIGDLPAASYILQATLYSTVGAMVVTTTSGPVEGIAVRLPVRTSRESLGMAGRDTAVSNAGGDAGDGGTGGGSGGGTPGSTLGWISGRVLNAAGLGVSGARLSLSGGAQPMRDIGVVSTAGGTPRVGPYVPWQPGAPSYSGAGGGFVLPDVPPGRYVIEARQGAALGTAELAVHAGQATQLDIRLG